MVTLLFHGNYIQKGLCVVFYEEIKHLKNYYPLNDSVPQGDASKNFIAIYIFFLFQRILFVNFFKL